MEFLVEFEVEVPAGMPDAEVEQRQRAESVAAAELAEGGHLVRLWRRPLVGDGTTAIGLYRADDGIELDDLLAALPLADWIQHTHLALGARAIGGGVTRPGRSRRSRLPAGGRRR